MAEGPKNVLIFVPEEETSYHLFMGRIEEYLINDGTVKVGWKVNTEEQFLNQLDNRDYHFWHALFVDAKIIQGKKGLIDKFIDRNPNARIGLLFTETRPQSIFPIEGAVMFTDWGDIDNWLLMMHRLL